MYGFLTVLAPVVVLIFALLMGIVEDFLIGNPKNKQPLESKDTATE